MGLWLNDGAALEAVRTTCETTVSSFVKQSFQYSVRPLSVIENN